MGGVGPSGARLRQSRTSCSDPASLSGPQYAPFAASATRPGSMAADTSSRILSGMTVPANSTRLARSATRTCMRASGSQRGGRPCCYGLRWPDRGFSHSRLILQASGSHLMQPIPLVYPLPKQYQRIPYSPPMRLLAGHSTSWVANKQLLTLS